MGGARRAGGVPRTEERFEHARVGAEHLGGALAAQATQQHLQPVQQRLERQITAQRVATPGQDDDAPARAVEQRRQQRALPDARLTDDEHRALGRVGVQHPVQPAQLVIPTGHRHRPVRPGLGSLLAAQDPSVQLDGAGQLQRRSRRGQRGPDLPRGQPGLGVVGAGLETR